MEEIDFLQPKEVLAHLNALGYRDISPKQLKEFLQDLRKLIKYDQKRISQKCDECVSSQSLEEPDANDFECSCAQTEDNSDKLSSNDSYASSYSSSSSVTCRSQGSTKREKLGRRSLCTRHGIDKELVHKSQTSFIRPWQLPPHIDSSNKNRKNVDPVKLYHQYKMLWNRQKIPGENNHAQLRWGIRNRMLGEEPHPRVII